MFDWRRIDALEQVSPFVIRQRIGRDGCLDATLAKIRHVAVHHRIEREVQPLILKDNAVELLGLAA